MGASFANSVDVDELTGLFFSNRESLGSLKTVSAMELPDVPRQLLAHNHHMTVTLEKYYNTLLDVEVLNTRHIGSRYSREILLRTHTNPEMNEPTQSRAKVVQYGIVRLDFSKIKKSVVHQIEQAMQPLGRVLIENNVHREVRLQNLYRIKPSAYLQNRLQMSTDGNCYGRTAMIYCDNEPAIELLEIVV